MRQKTICLNMIVKNEARVIERCLQSIKPWIDSWVIVDTGSTDGTQEIIRACLQDRSGELHESEWVDFSHNRNQALRLAKGKSDYILFIDADEFLVVNHPAVFDRLEKDCYAFWIHQKENSSFYLRNSLISQRIDWEWQGVIHEQITTSQSISREILEGLSVCSITTEGARYQDPDKYLKDATILERELQKDPSHAIYQHYLGLSYEAARAYDRALPALEKAIEMNLTREAVFYCLYRKAVILKKIGAAPDLIIASFQQAYVYRPTRIEPLYWLADYHLEQNDPLSAYVVSHFSLSLPLPNDVLYVELAIYYYGRWLLFAKSAALLGYRQEAIRAFDIVLRNPYVPAGTCLEVARQVMQLGLV